MEPLAIACNVTQGNDARMDVVLLCLANLFRIYSNLRYPEDVRHVILESLEKRWAKTDQILFVLAIVFNPWIRLDCFGDQVPIHHFPRLWTIFWSTYKRLFSLKPGPNGEEPQPPPNLRSVLREYIERRGDWSNEAMGLESLKQAADAQVSFPIHKIALQIAHTAIA
jgi:hypothetical protein